MEATSRAGRLSCDARRYAGSLRGATALLSREHRGWVSVGIERTTGRRRHPGFRRPQFIPEAIESVLAQTYSNWRLVVSENGPGGGEVEAAVRQSRATPGIRYVATGRNLGPAAF